MIEKAWAKLCGSYASIVMGTADMGFIHLCGMPSLGLKHAEFRSKRDELWRKLKIAQASGHIIVAGTSDKQSDVETLRADGIIGNHCYTVLSTHEVMKGGKTFKIIKIRNPWGSMEWNGNWSDHSPMWTDDLRTQVGSCIGDDGIFCIALEDFIRCFSATNICKFEDDIAECHTTCSQPHESGANQFLLNLSEDQVGPIDILVS